MTHAIQDLYPERFAHCWGCGRENPQGLHLKSHLDGDETVATFSPGQEFSGGVPGNVYGGFIASLSTATAPPQQRPSLTGSAGTA